jgi:hypothetical protein
LLFGIGGVAAVIALLVGVFLLFDDIFKGNFGADTFHRMRYSIGVLITTCDVAGYHWMIYRAEREQIVASLRGPRFVLMVGPKDQELIRAVSQRTGGRVQAWTRKDGNGDFGSVENVMTILDNAGEESIILLADADGVRVIPVDRD